MISCEFIHMNISCFFNKQACNKEGDTKWWLSLFAASKIILTASFTFSMIFFETSSPTRVSASIALFSNSSQYMNLSNSFWLNSKSMLLNLSLETLSHIPDSKNLSLEPRKGNNFSHSLSMRFSNSCSSILLIA